MVDISICSQRNVEYTIVKGNEQNKFELIKKHGVWALHFKRRLREPDNFELIIYGRPANEEARIDFENDIYEKPLTLRVRLNVTE